MTTKTITQSEIETAHAAFAEMYGASAPVSFRAALESIGFEIVPDPIPEPEGDVIVIGANGKAVFRRLETHNSHTWEGLSGTCYGWDFLTKEFGPLRIFSEVKP